MVRSRATILLLVVVAAGAAACFHGATPEAAVARSPRVPNVVAERDAPSPIAVRPGPNAREGSAVLLAEMDGRAVAWVADEDDAMVRVVDVEDGLEIARASVGGVPAQLVMTKDGKVIASLRDAARVVWIVPVRSRGVPKLMVERTLDVALEPIGLALSPDDKTLVVASGWGRTVSVVDLATAKVTEHAVDREPRAVTVSSDGKRAFVSHAVGQRLDVVPLDGKAAPKPLVLSGILETTGRHMSLGSESREACQGFALAKSDGRVFAPHVLAFTGDPGETSSGYGSGGNDAEAFHVPVIDEDDAKVVPGSMTVRAGLSTMRGRCSLPRAATVGKAGLFVTCLGDDLVELFDADAVNVRDVEVARWSVPAGPTGIAVDDARERAVVWSQMAHALTTIGVGEGKPLSISSVTLPRVVRPSAKIERGRALFHATSNHLISSDGRACASCHPDGRDDALVWSSPNGPRQTPILAGRLAGAAPYGWNGDAADVSTHLTSTFGRLGGSGLGAEDKEALIAYVGSLRSPPARAPKDRAAIARGLAIFRSEKTACASCHGESGDLPDGNAHDVKSRTKADSSAKFDTPSLRFVSGSGPWFHDGRYSDLETLLVKSDGKMGHTKHLSKAELGDLRAYLESL